MEPIFKFEKNRQLPLRSKVKKARDLFLHKIACGEYNTVECNCICGAKKDDVLIATVDRYGVPVNTFICKHCGLLRIDPYLDDVSLQKFYNTDYDKIYRTTLSQKHFFNEQVKSGERILSAVSKIKSDLNEAIVMEIGCSMGGNLLPFKRVGCSVFGADYNEDHVCKGRQLGMDLRVGSWSQLQDAAPADILILSHVLEHMTDPIAFLKNIMTLVKDDGFLYIAVPAVEDIPESYDHDIMLWLQNAHAYNFSNVTLKEVVAHGGAKPVWDNGKGIVIAQKTANIGELSFAPDEADAVIRKMQKYELQFLKNRTFFRWLSHKLKSCANTLYELLPRKLTWCIKMFLPYGFVRYIQKQH